jgi:hypothetical protein
MRHSRRVERAGDCPDATCRRNDRVFIARLAQISQRNHLVEEPVFEGDGDGKL